jgi:thiosulfate/3-mercaptopyruvate sulfurtransferase
VAIISVQQLAERLDDPRLRVVDTRWYLLRPGDGRAAYESGHIPGAIFVDLDSDLAAHDGPGRHPLPTPAEFRARMEAAGIATDSDVVVYDDVGGTIAARLWWMLDNLGHESVSILDGGIQAWIAAGQPLTRDATNYEPADLELRDEWTNVVDRDMLALRLRDVTLLDSRAPERYRGEIEPIDPAAGHIPTAISAPTTANLGADGRFLSSEELRLRFEDLGAAEGTVVTYCGSGANACHNILAMRLAGLDDPVLYAGSFSDWSTAGLPVLAGDIPGDPTALESNS